MTSATLESVLIDLQKHRDKLSADIRQISIIPLDDTPQAIATDANG